MSDGPPDARLDAIATDPWIGRGSELLALLADDDPHVRSALSAGRAACFTPGGEVAALRVVRARHPVG